MTPSRALRVKSELVLTLQPFITGMAHAATATVLSQDVSMAAALLGCITLGNRNCSASLTWLGGLLHLDQAHPTVASNGETVVVAEARNLHTCHGCCLEYEERGRP